jgi:hypothetical protein
MRNWIEGQASEITAAVPELRSTLSGLEGRTDPAAMFLRDALIGLVAEIEQFRAHEKAGVAQRLAWSERVEDLTVERHEKSWSEARAAISAADGIRASKLYSQHPIDLTPQMGLIPIGMNPVTKLWEFYPPAIGVGPTERDAGIRARAPELRRTGRVRHERPRDHLRADPGREL